jgi:hypothetical protein
MGNTSYFAVCETLAEIYDCCFLFTRDGFSACSDSLVCEHSLTASCTAIDTLHRKEIMYKQCAVNTCAFSKAVLLLH